MTLVESTPIVRNEAEAIKDIFEMHRYCRPMGSKAEKKFIAEYLTPLGVTQDACGNLYKYIGESRVLWSSHTDTVHHISGFQRITVEKGMKLKLHRESSSNCLGADCTAGVFLMREMILAQVPGLYIFHHGEERGGIGSSFIRSKTPELLKDVKFAIAFDRYGKTSIITHQGGSRCCSKEFTTSLDAALGGGYKGDSGGSFTDTANYTGIVPECTNISVGYMHQHSKGETQDIRYLLDLRKKLLTFDESKLVEKRKAGEREYVRYPYSMGDWEGDEGNWFRGDGKQHDLPLAPHQNVIPYHRRYRYSELSRLIRENAAAVADWMEMEGMDYEYMREEIMNLQGFVKE